MCLLPSVDGKDEAPRKVNEPFAGSVRWTSALLYRVWTQTEVQMLSG